MTTNTTTPTQGVDIREELEAFLYTPYGLGTLAGVAIILTSLLWCIGCCIYCCYRKAHSSQHTEGTLEVSREMEYIGVSSIPPIQQHHHRDGTMSSGYSTGPPSNTLNSQAGAGTNNNTVSLSLDSYHHGISTQ